MFFWTTHQWIIEGAPKTCSPEVPVKLREIQKNTNGLPVKCEEKTRTKNEVYPDSPSELAPPKPIQTLCFPVVVFDRSKYFEPKQPIPEPKTHQDTQLPVKNKTMVKLSNTSWG